LALVFRNIVLVESYTIDSGYIDSGYRERVFADLGNAGRSTWPG